MRNFIGSNVVKSSRSSKKAFKLPLLLLIAGFLIAASLFCLCACNSAPMVKEGIVTYKDYGNPIFESQGIFDFRIAGDPDYFIKVEDSRGAFQWYRVLDKNLYNSISVGDHFVFDGIGCRPQKSFLQRK